MTSTADLRAPRRDPTGSPAVASRRRGARWGSATALAVVLAWALASTGVGFGSLIAGRGGAARLVSGLLTPDVTPEFLRTVASAALETVQISLAGLVFAAVFGVPLAILQAGNVGAGGIVRSGARVLAAALRGIPELLWALLFVATVGLGPAAGVYPSAYMGPGSWRSCAARRSRPWIRLPSRRCA